MARKGKEFKETGYMSKNVDMEKALKEKQVLTGRVIKYREASESGEPASLLLNIDGKAVYVLKGDIGVLPHKRGPISQVGCLMSVVLIKKAEDGNYYASRKEAVVAESQDELEKMRNGEFVTGVVGNVTPFGAYIRFGAGMEGLLRNVAFSDDTTCVKDVYKSGDLIKVGLLKEYENNSITLKPEKKYTGDSIINFEDIQVEDLYYGVVKIVKDDRVYTAIGDKLMVLSPFPQNNQPIDEGMKVQIVITKIIEDEKRLKGSIKRILGY